MEMKRVHEVATQNSLDSQEIYRVARQMEEEGTVMFRPSPGKLYVSSADVETLIRRTREAMEQRAARSAHQAKAPGANKARTAPEAAATPPAAPAAIDTDGLRADIRALSEAIGNLGGEVMALATQVSGLREGITALRDTADMTADAQRAQLGALQVTVNHLDANSSAVNSAAGRIEAATQELAKELRE